MAVRLQTHRTTAGTRWRSAVRLSSAPPSLPKLRGAAAAAAHHLPFVLTGGLMHLCSSAPARGTLEGVSG